MAKYSNNKKFNFNLYDKKHLANLVLRAKFIQSLFDEAAQESVRIGASTGFNDPASPFFFSDYPQAKKRIDDVINQLHSDLVVAIEEGDREEWLLACEKNNKLVDSIVGSTMLSKAQISAWKHPNLNALEAFQSRKIDGLKLSSKVWNITDQFKGELELALDIGLGEGKSAAELSRDVRKYLNEPDKLFRRVRDKHGNLRLSQSAKNYNPGQGVYRSSYKNALRLTTTENNIAYRTSDHERWQATPFVIGIEIKLSNNHTSNGLPLYDICDELKGMYPKDFKFTGWHPFCRCFAVPVLADMKQFLESQQRLDGEDVSRFKFTGEVKDVPNNFKAWVQKNENRIAAANSKGNLPYFLKDNRKSWSGLTSIEYINVYKIAETKAAAKLFQQKSKKIADELGVKITNVNIKKTDRILEKALTSYDGDVFRVGDIIRNTFVVEPSKIEATIDKIKSNFRVLNRKEQSTSMGYTGNLMNVLVRNGVKAEIQVNTPQMIYAKEVHAESIIGSRLFKQIQSKCGIEHGLGHKYYEEYRTLESMKNLTKAQAARMSELEKLSIEYYKKIKSVIL